MWDVLHRSFPVEDVDVWTEVFAAGRPVVAENYDLHAAYGLYHFIHNHLPQQWDDYRSAMLTWQWDDYRSVMLTWRNYLRGKRCCTGKEPFFLAT